MFQIWVIYFTINVTVLYIITMFLSVRLSNTYLEFFILHNKVYLVHIIYINDISPSNGVTSNVTHFNK